MKLLAESILLALLLFCPPASHAQDETGPRWPQFGGKSQSSLSFNAGLGVFSVPGDADLFLGLSGNTTLRRGDWLFSGRILYGTESPIILFFEKEPRETLWEAAMLAGLRYRKGWFFIGAKAGLGLTGGLRRGAFLRRECSDKLCINSVSYYESQRTLAVGLPVEAELVFAPLPYLGLGVRFAGNVNTVRSFAGWFFTLHLGQLR